MPRFVCSICSAPSEVREAVSAALIAGESGRAIAARSAFSKSSIYRHRQKCIDRAVLRGHREARHFAGDMTVAVQWEGQPMPNTDIVISVEYQTATFRNPPERWAMEAAPEAEAAAADDATAADEPSPEAEMPASSLAEPELPAAELAQSKCDHRMVAIASGIERCQNCGLQTQAAFIAGVGRNWRDEQPVRDPLRSMGRFAR